MHQLGFRVETTSSLHEEADRLTELQQWNAGELVVNSLQLEVVGALVRCQKSRQDTKTTRRRCVVEVGSRARSKSVELCRTARRFPREPRARLRQNGVWLFARNLGVENQQTCSFRTKVRGLG